MDMFYGKIDPDPGLVVREQLRFMHRLQPRLQGSELLLADYLSREP